MNGFLLLDKPSGISSFKAIKMVQKKLDIKKIGHCGTLDPLATGMLPLVINEGTKYAQYISSSHKAYEVTIQFGLSSDTYDIEGEITKKRNIGHLSKELINQFLTQLTGKISQQPPKFSAIKVNGQRAYSLARAGSTFELAKREVDIKCFNLLDLDDTVARFFVHCSKGTYIRSLIHDLGEMIGCGAIMTQLKRFWVNPFQDNPMYSIEEINTSHIIPIEHIFKHKIHLTQAETNTIQTGGSIEQKGHENLSNNEPLALLDPNKTFIGIAVIKENEIRPKRLMSSSTS